MINKVILAGSLAEEPSARQTAAGDYVCNIVLSVRRNGSTSKTDNIICEAWGNTALFLSKYTRKGTKLDVEGSLRVRRNFDPEKKTNTFEQLVRIDTVDFSSAE